MLVVGVAEVESVETAGIADVLRAAEDLRFVDVPQGDVGPHRVEVAQVEEHVVPLGHLVHGVDFRTADVQVGREDRRQRRVEFRIGGSALNPLGDPAVQQAVLLFLAAVLGRGEIVPAGERIGH